MRKDERVLTTGTCTRSHSFSGWSQVPEVAQKRSEMKDKVMGLDQ